MTLPAWRPLKDAPKNLPAYVEDGNGTHVATWDDEWGYWLGEELRILSEDTLSLPIADTLELDRAVQVKIAEAFGALVYLLRAANETDGFAAVTETFVSENHAIVAGLYRRDALREFRRILHTSMGGRIPDEVP